MENQSGKIALITGASSGIGFELTRCFARDNYQVIMVAHFRDKLQAAAQQIQQEFPTVTVHTIAIDLSKDNAPDKLFTEVQQHGWQLDALVNNAGFGEYGPFAESDWAKESAMIHLNVISLVHMTKLFLPGMLSRNSGKILQLGSVASFMPAPLQSVYGATKAFILSFSEALQEELKETNVTVTVLCPPATDTNFFKVAGAENSKMVQDGSMASAEEVAAGGYEALIKGDARAVPTFKAKMEVAQANILPDSVVATMMHKQSEEKKPEEATANNESTSEAAENQVTTSETTPKKKASAKSIKAESTADEAPAKKKSSKKKE
ncbi:MAG: hypothetical protein COW65_08845 [Cytophagales bacterium CG18_big_fil_WC_8_21_14_2_50_42_9]|nr:MAG: hypothetical protein COW65_08845 [Cytophagales bacterium CG18_big_fil_WC_8_21_14_2_50_42_9]